MNMLRPLLVVVVGFSLALPGIAPADHYAHGYKYKHGHKKQHRHYNRQHGGYGYQGRHITRYYKRDNSNEKLLIGLLMGGIAGYAISNAQKMNAYNYPHNYPPAQPAQTYPVAGHQYSVNSCLQEREYQTTVVVGGKNVPAYGTACLQPDGSWRHGPAQPESY